MRIAIDATAVPRRLAGAGVYTSELVRALTEVAEGDRLFVFARPGLFDDLPRGPGRLRVLHVDPGSRPARLAWEQTTLPLLLRRLRIDVLHSPHHHTPLLAGLSLDRSTRRPGQVVTFHDVTFLLLPRRYPLVRRLYMEAVTRASARRADAVIAPSESARRDVLRALRLAPERVVAVPEAAAPWYRPILDEARLATLRTRYRLPERFVLSVGSLEPGKNRTRLIRACAALGGTRFGCPLVVAGQPAWKYNGDFELVHELGLRDQVSFLGYVPEEDMPALYSAATLLAFPSLHEGFGLPVLEAMACGTPVVTSSVSATAEVAGDAALLVDPRDTDAITGALGRLLSDGWLRAELRDRGFEQARAFSWQRTARETRSVYEVVAATR